MTKDLPLKIDKDFLLKMSRITTNFETSKIKNTKAKKLTNFLQSEEICLTINLNDRSLVSTSNNYLLDPEFKTYLELFASCEQIIRLENTIFEKDNYKSYAHTSSKDPLIPYITLVYKRISPL